MIAGRFVKLSLKLIFNIRFRVKRVTLIETKKIPQRTLGITLF